MYEKVASSIFMRTPKDAVVGAHLTAAKKTKLQELLNTLNRVYDALTNGPNNQELKEEYEITKDQVKLKMAERAGQRDHWNSNNHFTFSECVNFYFF